MCSGTVHELFLSVGYFSLHSGEVNFFICMFGESNDAAGHNRRWHLLLMVTPAHGRPCGQAPGEEKLGREEREYGDVGTGGGRGGVAATKDQQMEVFVTLFNYTCTFEKSLSGEAQATGLLFF